MDTIQSVQPQVLIDMDGVLVDFITAACRAHNRPNPYYDQQGNPVHIPFDVHKTWLNQEGVAMTDDTFWEIVNSDSHFWHNLQPTSICFHLLNYVEMHFGRENACILSKPSKHPACTLGKHFWLNKHLPEYSRRFLFGPKKQFTAAPYRILIDDNDKNIADFIRHGGIGVLVPQPWNADHALARQQFTTVKRRLAHIHNYFSSGKYHEDQRFHYADSITHRSATGHFDHPGLSDLSAIT